MILDHIHGHLAHCSLPPQSPASACDAATRGDELEREVVARRSLLDHAAVPVARRLAETRDHEPVGGRLLHRTRRLQHDPSSAYASKPRGPFPKRSTAGTPVLDQLAHAVPRPCTANRQQTRSSVVSRTMRRSNRFSGNRRGRNIACGIASPFLD